MKFDLNQRGSDEVRKLEELLFDYKKNWEEEIRLRASTWRSRFLIVFAIVLFATINLPSLWWLNIIVISYFAGSLFTLIHQRNKTNKQIVEHQKQLKLIRLLRKFKTSPSVQDKNRVKK